jgi:hypothetical protein
MADSLPSEKTAGMSRTASIGVERGSGFVENRKQKTVTANDFEHNTDRSKAEDWNTPNRTLFQILGQVSHQKELVEGNWNARRPDPDSSFFQH